MRPSAIPLAVICPQSAKDEGLSIEEAVSEYRDLGTAVHATLASALTGEEQPPLPPGVDAEEHGRMVGYCMKIWREDLQAHHPDPMTEYRLRPDPRGLLDGGTVDVLSLDFGRASIIDWKTGRTERDYREQMRAYAYLVFLQYPEILEVVATVVYAPLWKRRTYRWSRDMMRQFESDMADIGKDNRYVVGAHCSMCPRQSHCPAREEWDRHSLSIVTGEDLGDVPSDSLHAAIKYVKSRIKTAEDELRRRVPDDGSEVRIGNEFLWFREVSRRRIDPQAAWSHLQDELTSAEIRPAVSMTLKGIESVLIKKYGREKAKETIAQLEDAGAITRETGKQFASRPAPAPNEQEVVDVEPE